MIEKLYKKKNILKTFLELKYNIEFFFLENVIILQYTMTITLQYYSLFGTQRSFMKCKQGEERNM